MLQRPRPRRSPPLSARAALLTLALLACATPAAAIDYVVELVLFEHVGSRAPGAGGFWVPAPQRAVSLGTPDAAALGFVPSEAPLELAGDVEAMRASGRYRVLQHLAWRQPGLATADAVPIRIALGQRVQMYVPERGGVDAPFLPASLDPRPNRTRPVTTTTVAGTLKLRLGRFLHLETQLAYTDLDSGRSYRMSESRRMRSRELHYIDNPRIGILTRIVPVEADELPDSAIEALPADDDTLPATEAPAPN